MSKGHARSSRIAMKCPKVGAPAATLPAADQATVAGREAAIAVGQAAVSQTRPVAEAVAAAMEGGMTLAVLAIMKTEAAVSQTRPVAEAVAAAMEGGMTLALLAIIQATAGTRARTRRSPPSPNAHRKTAATTPR
jgi:hypothetical protein